MNEKRYHAKMAPAEGHLSVCETHWERKLEKLLEGKKRKIGCCGRKGVWRAPQQKDLGSVPANKALLFAQLAILKNGTPPGNELGSQQWLFYGDVRDVERIVSLHNVI
jgi:hypothetical protein